MSHRLRIWIGGPQAGALEAWAAALERDPAFAVERASGDVRPARSLGGEPATIALVVLSDAGDERWLEREALSRTAPPTALLAVASAGATPGIEAALARWRAGPVDVVARDADVREVAWRARRLGELAQHLADLEQRASHDERTGLLRAGEFERRIDEHVSAAERHGHEMALLVLDLDRFGAINKAHDHTVGDSVIAEVGRAITRGLRREDVAGRLGGDEFGLLLPYTPRIDAARVAMRVLSSLRALRIETPRTGASIEVRASLGFETFDGHDVPSTMELRARAEAALRVAKEGGGDRAVYFRSLAR